MSRMSVSSSTVGYLLSRPVYLNRGFVLTEKVENKHERAKINNCNKRLRQEITTRLHPFFPISPLGHILVVPLSFVVCTFHNGFLEL